MRTELSVNLHAHPGWVARVSRLSLRALGDVGALTDNERTVLAHLDRMIEHADRGRQLHAGERRLVADVGAMNAYRMAAMGLEDGEDLDQAKIVFGDVRGSVQTLLEGGVLIPGQLETARTYVEALSGEARVMDDIMFARRIRYG